MSDDPLDQPVEYRYPSGERPTEPPMEQPAFDPPTDPEWANYWDVNPIHHGGRFIQFEDGKFPEWTIIEVSPPSSWPEDEHIREEIGVRPEDVWEDPEDPMTDFTDTMKSILRQFNGHPVHPNGEGAPFVKNVTYYVADFVHFGGGGRPSTRDLGEDVDVEEYWDFVGIDPTESDVTNVSGSDLPGDD
jgi:hypothetical protein